jgi:hypothetical protein
MFLTKDTKSPYFHIVYIKNGKRTKKSTKCKRRAEALKVLENFKTKSDAVNKEQIVSLSYFNAEYLNYCNKSKSKSYIERSIIPAFNKFNSFAGNVPLNKINARQVDQFITSIYNYSKSAAGLYYRTLKAAFSKAVVWEYIQENPFKKIKAPKISK